MRKCPLCAEEIQDEAKKCKHCGEFVDANNLQENKGTKIVENAIPLDIQNNATAWRVHKIKDPKKYGGWSRFMLLWMLIPIVGIVVSIPGLMSENTIKNAQAKILLIASIVFIFFGIINYNG